MSVDAPSVGARCYTDPLKRVGRQVAFLQLRAVLAVVIVMLGFAASVRADNLPTDQDFLKSLSTSVDQPTDGRKVLAVAAIIVGAMVLMVVLSRRQNRATVPVKLNHQGKLLKELMKTAGLTRAQAKTLKVRAEKMATEGTPLQSPVTLLLCPSLMQENRAGGNSKRGA